MRQKQLEMSPTHGLRTPIWRSAWLEKCRAGEFNLEDREGSGRQVGNRRLLEAVVDANPKRSTGEIAEDLNVDHAIGF